MKAYAYTYLFIINQTGNYIDIHPQVNRWTSCGLFNGMPLSNRKKEWAIDSHKNESIILIPEIIKLCEINRINLIKKKRYMIISI